MKYPLGTLLQMPIMHCALWEPFIAAVQFNIIEIQRVIPPTVIILFQEMVLKHSKRQ
jgi:hypothetical protein